MTYLLRDIPDDVWRKFRAKAAREGVPARTVLLRLIRAYLRGAA